MVEARTNLGRGLAALLGDINEDAPGAASGVDGAPQSLEGLKISRHAPIEFLHAGKYQPRRKFDEAELEALIKSIQEKGILQPILVRNHPDIPGQFEIIAGERRWRAAQLAQVHELPIIVKDLSDRDCLEISLIENIQRADLTPIEEAEGYQRLIDEFDHTQEDISKAMGKSRSHVANMLRLLALPPSVREYVQEGQLSMGHARALINSDDPASIARQIIRKSLSVRQVERLVKNVQNDKLPEPANSKGAPSAYGLNGSGAPATLDQVAKSIHDIPGASLAGEGAQRPGKDPNTIALEQTLTEMLGLTVTITSKGDGGVMSIHYSDLEQLDDVIMRLKQY